MSEVEQPPAAPREPYPEECCGSGCTLCVFDRYQQALERYREQMRAWQAAHATAAADINRPNEAAE